LFWGNRLEYYILKVLLVLMIILYFLLFYVVYKPVESLDIYYSSSHLQRFHMSSHELDSLLTEEDMEELEMTLWNTVQEPSISLAESRDEQESSVIPPEDLEVKAGVSVEAEVSVAKNKTNWSKYSCTHGRYKYNCSICNMLKMPSTLQPVFFQLGSFQSVSLQTPSYPTPGQTDVVPIVTPGTIPCDIKDTLVHEEVKLTSRKRKRCPHGRERSRCSECDGSGLCEHKQQITSCAICNQCIHGIHKYRCSVCDGRHLCEHDQVKYQCKKCKAARELHEEVTPTHDRNKNCPHGRARSRCIECGGSALCEHKLQQSTCVRCNQCIHGIYKYICSECDGRHLCKHDRVKYRCRYCKAARKQDGT